jgi:DNA-binding SARP family transcriptional activator
VELRILGPIDVRRDGTTVEVRGVKRRQLLALLAIRPNQPIAAEQLIDELWQGDAPRSAATALRVHIRHLRQVLDVDREPSAVSLRLPSRAGGYLLSVHGDELDASRFERLVFAARDALAAGDPQLAVASLAEALDLWRGPALSDVRDLAAAHGAIARLDDLRAAAIEDLADTHLALGDHAAVVDLVSAAVEQYPFRERLTASLVRGLYRSGRQADALRAYADLAHRLDEGLGVPPSPELRQLEEDVLLQRPSLDVPSTRTPPRTAQPSTRSPVARFIGRRDEAGRLLDTFARASVEPSRLVLVTGEAGIGKTTLIQEFCARARELGAHPLIGRCDAESTANYQPIVEILRTVVGRLDPDGRAALPGPVALLLPDMVDGERVPDHAATTPAQAAQFRLFEAIAHTCASSAGRPILLIVEDLHWADRPTLRALRHLLLHPMLDRMLVVATCRDDEIDGERAEAINRLATSGRSAKLAMSGFDDHEVRALVRAVAPPAARDVLVDCAATLCDTTGGNPLFLRELLSEFDDHRFEIGDTSDVAHTLSRLAPFGVRALVDDRLGRLSPAARTVVGAASVVGSDFTVDTLAAVCDLSADVTYHALHEGLVAHLLIEDAEHLHRYQFHHMLVRNCVYQTVPTTSRQQLHRRTAEILERTATSDTTARNATLAYHYGQAAPLGVQREAAEYAERAGDDATAQFAFAEAVRWYGQAVRLRAGLGTPEPAMGRLYLVLGQAQSNDKQPETARDSLLAAAGCARQANDPLLLADVAIAADDPWALGADFQPDVLSLLEEALDRLDAGAIETRVQILTRIASDLYYVDPEREGRVAHEALNIAESSDQPATRATAQMAVHLWQTHEPSAARARLMLGRHAHELATRGRDTSDVHLLTHRALLADLLENAAIAEFATSLDAYERAAETLGSPRDIYWSMALRATEMTLHGDLQAAEQLARGAALRGHELEQFSDGAYLLQRFVIRYQQGRLAEELPVLKQVGGQRSVYRAGGALAAVAYAETGQPDRARAVAWNTIGDDGTDLPRDAFWLAATALLAGVAATINDRPLLELLHTMLEPCAEQIVVFGAGGAVLGAAHHWLGLVAAAQSNTDLAVDHFAEAITRAHQLGAPYWTAQATMDTALAIRSRGRAGDTARVAQLVDAALDQAQSAHYGRVLAQAPASPRAGRT